MQQMIDPVRVKQNTARSELLAALKKAVPSPELALGQRPDCTISEFADNAAEFLNNASFAKRATLDLLAAFGAEIDSDPAARIVPTPFCFITGSGHQWFLDTVRQLMAKASEQKVREALFEPWCYRDEKLTKRWDPLDDRRYAMMDRDPTASDNKSSTVWMANLLAYRALALFPCAPVTGSKSIAASWSTNGDGLGFIWPLWERALSLDSIRSLFLSHSLKDRCSATYQRDFFSRGVSEVFRSRRIQVGNPPLHKVNFTSATAL
jgi:hypothetical protein